MFAMKSFRNVFCLLFLHAGKCLPESLAMSCVSSIWYERAEGNWSNSRTNLMCPGKEIERKNRKNRKGVEKVTLNTLYTSWLTGVQCCISSALNLLLDQWWLFLASVSSSMTLIYKNRNNCFIPVVLCALCWFSPVTPKLRWEMLLVLLEVWMLWKHSTVLQKETIPVCSSFTLFYSKLLIVY